MSSSPAPLTGVLRTPESPFRGLALLDRDGCLIEDMHYLYNPAEVRLLPGAVEALKLLGEQGIARVLCTNQSGVGRGIFPESQVEPVHQELLRQLHEAGTTLDAIYYSTYHKGAEDPRYREGAEFRKPAIGMAMKAMADLGLENAPCFAIGDKESDVRFGENAGGFGVLVRTGKGTDEEATHGDALPFVCDGVYPAVVEALHELLRRELPEDPVVQAKLKSASELRRIVQERGARGESIGFANGCFDLLHGGHISFLENSRSAGDALILGVNSNQSIRRLKGKGRPVLSEAFRLQLLAALKPVDYLTVFYNDSADQVLEEILPHYHAKGTDYQSDNVPELITTRRLGIRTVIAGNPKENSTRDIITVIQERARQGIL